jgi:exopolysaccharide biosynthesis polyprenyl glycosylphosphotransferase
MLTEEARREAETPPLVVVPRAATRRYQRLKIWVGVTDVVAFIAALAAAFVLRHALHPMTPTARWFLILVPFVQLAIFGAFSLYSLSRLAAPEEFRRILGAVSCSIGTTVILAFWFGARYSRWWIGLAWLLALVFVLVTRRLWHAWMVRARSAGRLNYRTLIIGTNDEAEHLTDALHARYHGFHVVGHVPTTANGGRIPAISRFADIDRLEEVIQSTGADCLFVASTALTTDQMGRVMRAARQQKVEVRISANISNITATRLAVQPIGSMMALTLRPVKLSGVQAATKRALDVSLASILLVLGIPFFGVAAAAIKLTSKGPVFYRQERVGLHGVPFRIIKFRTMIPHAETMAEELRHLNVAQGALFNLKNDPRVTKVGRILRRWSLDELPQIFNVLKGEMSLVGPRPPLPIQVAQYEEWHHERLEAMPGMTGLWQVLRHGKMDFDEYVRLDLFYIENWSITLDLFIILKTIPHLLFRKGEF